MKKILQINSTYNVGSTGRIAHDLGDVASANGFCSYIAYGRDFRDGASIPIKIGNKLSVYTHVLCSRLLDAHGLCSKLATIDLINHMKKLEPDIIHLHNIHGYYLHYPALFEFLKQTQVPVVWTLHDCWAFTGHCAHFEQVNCYKWQISCFDCPQIRSYPASYTDKSKRNFLLKRQNFVECPNLVVVSPSRWLDNYVEHSFLRDYPREVIYNGVDITTFSPVLKKLSVGGVDLDNKFVVLGVSSFWTASKGFHDFFEISKQIPSSMILILVGLNRNQIKLLPSNIIGIEKTQNLQDLAKLYSTADVFVNPTYADNFPTVNIEALACGTPVITYDTGGSSEAVDNETGIVVEQGNLNGIICAIKLIQEKGKEFYTMACRNRAVRFFSKNDRYKDYLKLYKRILEK